MFFGFIFIISHNFVVLVTDKIVLSSTSQIAAVLIVRRSLWIKYDSLCRQPRHNDPCLKQESNRINRICCTNGYLDSCQRNWDYSRSWLYHVNILRPTWLLHVLIVFWIIAQLGFYLLVSPVTLEIQDMSWKGSGSSVQSRDNQVSILDQSSSRNVFT